MAQPLVLMNLSKAVAAATSEDGRTLLGTSVDSLDGDEELDLESWVSWAGYISNGDYEESESPIEWREAGESTGTGGATSQVHDSARHITAESQPEDRGNKDTPSASTASPASDDPKERAIVELMKAIEELFP